MNNDNDKLKERARLASNRLIKLFGVSNLERIASFLEQYPEHIDFIFHFMNNRTTK